METYPGLSWLWLAWGGLKVDIFKRSEALILLNVVFENMDGGKHNRLKQ